MNLCNKNEIESKNACSYENYEHREILQNVSEKGTQLRTLRKIRKYRFFFFGKMENGIIMMLQLAKCVNPYNTEKENFLLSSVVHLTRSQPASV